MSIKFRKLNSYLETIIQLKFKEVEILSLNNKISQPCILATNLHQTCILAPITMTTDASQQNTYHDHSKDDNVEISTKTKGGVKIPFPEKLFQMLQHIDLQEPDLASIVSWQPHGRCFLVRDVRRFEEHVLPRFFKTTEYPSFRLQLNLWGFKCIQKKPDYGAYYHELFLRSKAFLHHRISRNFERTKALKASTARALSDAGNDEPDFYSMMSLPCSSTGIELDDELDDNMSLPPDGVVATKRSLFGTRNTFHHQRDLEGYSPQLVTHQQQAAPLLTSRNSAGRQNTVTSTLPFHSYMLESIEITSQEAQRAEAPDGARPANLRSHDIDDVTLPDLDCDGFDQNQLASASDLTRVFLDY